MHCRVMIAHFSMFTSPVIFAWWLFGEAVMEKFSDHCKGLREIERSRIALSLFFPICDTLGLKESNETYPPSP